MMLFWLHSFDDVILLIAKTSSQFF